MRRTMATWALASLIAVAVLYLLTDLLRTGPTGSLDVIELAETVPVASRATTTIPSANLRPANTTVHTANEGEDGDRGPARLDGGDDERGDDGATGLTPPFETGNDDDDDNDSRDDDDGGEDDH
jgi:hypothetical protein